MSEQTVKVVVMNLNLSGEMEVVMQKEINLKVLFAVVKKHLLLLIIFTGITTVIGGVYGMASEGSPPMYQSSASILLNTNDSDSVNTFEVILRDSTVLQNVIEELGLNKTINELNRDIIFSNDSKIVKIFVTDTNPELAAKIANFTAEVFIKQIGSILGIYDARVISEAQANNFPISESESPSLLKYLILGFGAGFMLSIGVVLFLDSLDETIQTEREIEQLLGLPVIGTISKMDSKNTKKKPVQQSRLKRGGANYGA